MLKTVILCFIESRTIFTFFFWPTKADWATLLRIEWNAVSNKNAKVNELQQWNAIHANANWPPKLQLLHWSAICAQIASKQIHLSPTLIFPSLHLEIQANHWMFIKLNPPIFAQTLDTVIHCLNKIKELHFDWICFQ
jgi:hypothetical protein